MLNHPGKKTLKLFLFICTSANLMIKKLTSKPIVHHWC